MTDSEHIIEYFACDCSSFTDTLKFSCFLPLAGDEEEDVLYLSTYIDQWRGGVFYKLWDGFKSLFSKEDRSYGWSLINKEFWEDYYRDSVWSRIAIAKKYLCGKKDFDHSIYNATILRNQDLSRLDNLLSNFSKEEKPCNNFETILDGRNHRLKISIDEMDEIDERWLITQYQFKSYTGFKRFWVALKYAFGSSNSCYGNTDEFEINKESAGQIKYIIKELKRRNKELEDGTKNETTRSNTA